MHKTWNFDKRTAHLQDVGEQFQRFPRTEPASWLGPASEHYGYVTGDFQSDFLNNPAPKGNYLVHRQITPEIGDLHAEKWPR